jgi:diguanylate cyclase (GGDEF)-like protein
MHYERITNRLPVIKAKLMDCPTESLLSRVTTQLCKLEKRDWELWTIVSITGILASFAFLVIALPGAFLNNRNVHFEITTSRPLAIGFFVLVSLLNTYLIGKRMELRHLREEIISATLQRQVIEQQSFMDPLTEIYNRRSLDAVVQRFISHARRRKVPLTFLMVDMDKFKDINSRFGHLTGDLVLAEAASLLKDSIRGSDALVRYGGDEFLILLADTTSEGAQRVIARIASHLAEWNSSSHIDNLTLSLSIGTAQWQDGQTLDQVLDIADRRMYENKNGTALTS